MSPEEIVRNFCNAFARRDITEITGFFSDDAVYHNIPVDPVSGRDGIANVLEQFLAPASACEFEILAIASSGQTVLTERIDRFVIGDKTIELPVMGTFELTGDGKISAWRDYFDMQQYVKQMS